VTHPAADDAGLSLSCRAGQHGYVVAALSGELDIASAPALREQLLSLLRPAASRLIIDLSAEAYADASGLAVLVSSGRRAGLPGGSLRLAAPSPEVARVLSVTGINQHLDIFPRSRLRSQASARLGAQRRPGPASPHAQPAHAHTCRARRAADDGALRVGNRRPPGARRRLA
jgi:anti-anti-sigma factor